MRMNGGETVSARVPGGRPAGSDQDTQASINRVDTGMAWCSEEAGHTHDDLELPSADAVLEIILLPVDDTPSERRYYLGAGPDVTHAVPSHPPDPRMPTQRLPDAYPRGRLSHRSG
jgi:hypothetical protein